MNTDKPKSNSRTGLLPVLRRFSLPDAEKEITRLKTGQSPWGVTVVPKAE